MPLPTNATVAIQGQPTTMQMLKRAFIVRLSDDALEAFEDLQNPPKVEVDFNEDGPGLHIGNTFYACRTSTETSHELYLRIVNQSRPMAPFKLYANVQGKFDVKRVVDDKVHEKVRNRTLEAERQRTERKTIMLEAPPPDLDKPTKKSKKEATTARRVVANATSSYASTSTKPAATPKESPNKAVDLSTMRSKVIHTLALGPTTAASVVRLCGSQHKEEVVSILRSVAEPVPASKKNTGPSPLQLRLESWCEVRPNEWPDLSSEQRLGMCRQARMAFRELHIPETDPIWRHAFPRPTGEESASAAGSSKKAGSSSLAERNAVMSIGTKKAKAETKRRPADVAIPSKNESKKGKTRDRDLDDGEDSSVGTPTSATRPPARRLPGSGFKSKPSETPPAIDSRSNSPLPPPPKKKGPVDGRKRELPAPSGPAKPLPPIAPPQVPSRSTSTVAGAAAAIRKKAKDSADRKERDRDSEVPEEKPRVKARESPVPSTLPSFKRKKRPQEDNESEYSDVPLSTSASKKRKLDGPPLSASERAAARDLSLPKKPIASPLPPRPREIKKEESPSIAAFSPPRSTSARSPLPPRPPVREQAPSTSSSSHGKVKTEARGDSVHSHRRSESAKLRRQIADYTSSEEEEGEEIERPSRTASRRPPPPTSSSTSDDQPPTKRVKTGVKDRDRPAFKPRPTLPADVHGLRRYYCECYEVHIELHTKKERAHERLEQALKRMDRRSGDDDDATDWEDLHPEEMDQLMTQYRAVKSEMERIRSKMADIQGSHARS